MANYVYIAASLDGLIATPDGGLDWLLELPNPTQDDYGYAAFMQKISAIVMGRGTFDAVLKFDQWPYELPVFVLSRSRLEIPPALIDRVQLKQGDVATIAAELKQQGYDNLYIDGGQTIQRFLAADLIDELTITRIPIVLGQGIPLFGYAPQSRQFEHQHTQVYPNGLVQSTYVRSPRE